MTESISAPSEAETSGPVDACTAEPEAARVPLCFVVDEESSIRHFVSLIMQGTCVDAEEFVDGRLFRKAITTRLPDLVFIDVSLEAGDAIESIAALGRKSYRGAVQLMSTRGAAVLENVKNIGEQHKLHMLPVLKKPFDSGSVLKIIHDLKIGTPPAVAARIDLKEALDNDWIEFWFQPKIDLRRKQLAGAEAFARARHPEFGILPPSAFMPGAADASLIRLSEAALANAIKAETIFAALGVRLRFSVNVPASILGTLPIVDIVRANKADMDQWQGLLIDVTEEQAISQIDQIRELKKTLSPLKINFAIDDFGRGYSALMRSAEIPFVEMKLDQSFVVDCSIDKAKAPVCKTVIDLAHNFGAHIVAVGVEKAADLVAMVTMGCDYGQGFLLGQPMPLDRFTALLRQRAGSRRAAA